jgi:hypothetical protein
LQQNAIKFCQIDEALIAGLILWFEARRDPPIHQAIEVNHFRTLGEYLFNLEVGKVKRNRSHDGGHLRTDRAMYKDELHKIWETQQSYFDLPSEFISEIEKIIFYQRPLKLKKDRVGKCSLEPKHYRANTARLEVQKFRYLQDINNLSNNWDCASSEYSSQVLPITQRISQAVILPLRFLTSKFILVGLSKPNSFFSAVMVIFG